MHSHSFVNYLPILLAFIVAAVAAPGPGLPPKYPTKCFTSIVMKPSRGPQTKWSALTTSCISTNTVTSTITPSTTSTITDTTTVTSTASTSTFTATETITSTLTDTSVTTSVSTSTSTTETVSTSLITTSLSFLPVEITVPGASFDQDSGSIKRDQLLYHHNNLHDNSFDKKVQHNNHEHVDIYDNAGSKHHSYEYRYYDNYLDQYRNVYYSHYRYIFHFDHFGLCRLCNQ
ncbi:hypothetical protein CLAIMM_01824 [Cladophialophora immunda]|nr:hypothetical protein CLAIMM_01824 [Cladophialophora immunda]